jgi:hypothetical protein
VKTRKLPSERLHGVRRSVRRGVVHDEERDVRQGCEDGANVPFDSVAFLIGGGDDDGRRLELESPWKPREVEEMGSQHDVSASPRADSMEFTS